MVSLSEMARLNIPLHDPRQFTWNSVDNTGTTEISSLSPRAWSRVYDDACDVGFEVKSHRTGVTRLFTMTREVKNDDNEITHWEFTSENFIDKRIVVTIFND